MKKTAPTAPSTKTKSVRQFLWIFLSLFVLIVLVSLHFYIVSKEVSNARHETEMKVLSSRGSFSTIREKEDSLISPLILADFEPESDKYESLKSELSQTISQWNKKGVLETASIYLRDLNQGQWMSINGTEQYLPGSLMKVAIMLYFLREEENHPGILNTTLTCDKPDQPFPKQAYEGDSIVPGKRYKISELLRYMVSESDNYATHVLSQQLNAQSFHKLFVDLNMPPDDINNTGYTITVREYSKLLRVLYNATYVNRQLSEFGLELLTKSKFSDGIAKKIPKEIPIARKFGERGINNVSDFSESGIVYYKTKPYLLTIMTRGNNSKEQATLISELSSQVFQRIQAN